MNDGETFAARNREIRRLAGKGFSYAQIARALVHLGVTRGAVAGVMHRARCEAERRALAARRARREGPRA